ncbi:MAG: sulfite exporter TauE/SafE family protein [Gammaproteobacteria bacterium]|nr:sulfite exporter TauE/SafE family protein [Gammaproteobacteria bacterium]
MTFEIGLIFSGIIISTIAIAIGIGGGILWMPLLLIVYKLNPQEAITTSLFIQVIGMSSGSVAYYRAGLVKSKLMFVLFLSAVPGVIIGSLLTVTMEEKSIQMAIGIMSIMLALLFVTGNTETVANDNYNYNKSQVLRILPIPAFFGFILGSLSLGVGEWLIPALRQRLKLGMTASIATVIPMMLLLTILASLIRFNYADTFHLKYFLYGAAGTIIGAQIGATISKRINERILKQSFIYLMTLVGIHLIFQSI